MPEGPTFNTASSASQGGDRPRAGRGIWAIITRPWFAPLLAQTVLCRVLLAAVLVLGAGHVMGISLWPCFFASVTGLPCPGCGMTRAVTSLLRGEWGKAMAFHPFAPGFLVMAALLAMAALAPQHWRERLVRGVDLFERRTCLPLLFLLCAFIYGLLRMGGLCTSPPVVSSSPVRAWLQERAAGER